jgi:hypothetical protein
MLKKIIGCLLLVMVLAITSQGQSDCWYYNYDGTAVNLKVFDNLVTVRIDPNLPSFNARQFAAEHEFLIDTFTVESAPRNFYLFGIEPNHSLSNVVTRLRDEASVLMVNPVVRDEYGERAKLDNSLSVIYKSTTAPAQIDSLQKAWQLTVREILDDIAFQIYHLDANQRKSDDITVLARRYYESGLCISVTPNLTSKMHSSTNDAYYGQQWPLKNTGQNGGTPGADIDWEIAQQYTNRSGARPVVALLDAGFDMDHEDLPSNWAYRPRDVAGEILGISPEDYWPGTECGQFYHAWCWHGTATLGVLEAYTNNGIGLAGTESRVWVMPIKIADASGAFDRESIERALTWASQPTGPAQIIAMPFICQVSYATWLEPIFRARYLAGVTLIAGAGNGEPGLTTVQYPASSPYVLAVGETNSDDDTAASSGGPALDLVAPAFDIWTLDQEGSDGLNPTDTGRSCNTNQNYACHLAGTSFATTMVAGIAAKLLLRNPLLLGDKFKDSAEVMYATLRNACDRQHYGVANDDYRRVNNAVGWGRVNADRALASISHGDPNNDLQIDVSDALYLIPYIFSGGPAPVPNICTGDANCDGEVDVSDAVFIISHVFSGGPAPCKIGLDSVCN